MTDYLRLCEVAKRLEIDPEAAYDKMVSAILNRLKISAYRIPKGIFTELNKIESIQNECLRIQCYHDLEGRGTAACKAIERIIKRLISFYGGFCFPEAFLRYLEKIKMEDNNLECNLSETNIENEGLRKPLIRFLKKRMDIPLGQMVELLNQLDLHTQQLRVFGERFGRYSIFSSSIPDTTVASEQRNDQATPRHSPERLNCISAVLSEINKLRIDLIHDKGEYLEKEHLLTINGLREHLCKLFSVVRRFKDDAERLSLFPTVGIVNERSEKVNIGPRMKMITEKGIPITIRYQDLAGVSVGAEYFFWQALDRRDYVLVPKKLP